MSEKKRQGLGGKGQGLDVRKNLEIKIGLQTGFRTEIGVKLPSGYSVAIEVSFLRNIVSKGQC